MVATRLVEVTAKGTEWAYGASGSREQQARSSSTQQPPQHSAPEAGGGARGSPASSASSSSPSRSSGYGTPGGRRSAVSPFSSPSSPYGWQRGDEDSSSQSFLRSVADSAYARMSQAVASLYSSSSSTGGYYYDDSSSHSRSILRTRSHSTVGADSTDPLSLSGRDGGVDDDGGSSLVFRRPVRRKSFTALAPGDLAMMFHNPYNSVRGRDRSSSKPASVSAVRALLALVPVTAAAAAVDDNHEGQQRPRSRLPTAEDPTRSALEDMPARSGGGDSSDPSAVPSTPLISNVSPGPGRVSPLASPIGGDDVGGGGMGPPFLLPQPQPPWRDPHGDGANGVTVSPSETASQIAEGTIRAMRDLLCDEAVELRTSLRFWTERWERPIYSWMEAGPHVWMSSGGYNHQLVGRKVTQIQSVLARRCATIGELQQHLLTAGWQRGVAQWGMLGHGGEWAAVLGFDGAVPDDAIAARRSHVQRDSWRNAAAPPPAAKSTRLLRHESSAASIHVQNSKDGGLFVDDPAFLAEWSVEAIALVRRLLKSASGGRVPIPHEENWAPNRGGTATLDDFNGALIVADVSDANEERTSLPAWVSDASPTPGLDLSTASGENRQGLVVTNLPLLVEEVSDLLTVMEEILDVQRRRRLDKFRPPPWLRRNWFVVATLAPPISYFLHKVSPGETVALVVQKIRDFFRDHLKEPLVAIFNELWKGRESFSDKQARMEAMESLKKMIRSWLDDTFPSMPEAKRIALSDAMDVTLLEQQKVESMKTFFEINNVIRMSFIEMQYMKKELLNALSAIDEMMAANDINMNMAAITPVAMLVYLTTRLFRFCFYALLKLGTSKEETYASFRHILTDIERLLVMRDNPPVPHSPSHQRRHSLVNDHHQVNDVQELCADDLGMIMLLIHECRSILWRSRRRFSTEAIRSVYEDLSELAGERGAVSVRQQLQILERMSRTYRFLQMRHI